MPKVVLADTSTLIIFQKNEAFDILKKVYKQLVTTPEIAQEEVKPLIHKIIQTDFRISDHIIQEFLKLNNELL